jgi:hypothetical protein
MSPEPVSCVIKVCALDAPYLDVVIPHMIRQAKYPFAEVVVIADPRTSFTGKYARRRGQSDSSYRELLARLEQSGIVTRVVWAEATPTDVRAVLGRYFQGGVDGSWSHDVTGAPVYSALLGLEAARHDLVLHMDADMFFHSQAHSWVAEGIAQLDGDVSLWFVMTHAGPPAGPLGTAESLGDQNRQYAVWDAERQLWRFRHMTSRYFLADRRRLRERLPVVMLDGGLAPLEQCFSAALERAGAFRANLSLEGSWDLHVEDHRPPFPAWARSMAHLIERGLTPPGQRGIYDLNLRRSRWRIPWRALILRECPGAIQVIEERSRAAS